MSKPYICGIKLGKRISVYAGSDIVDKSLDTIVRSELAYSLGREVSSVIWHEVRIKITRESCI